MSQTVAILNSSIDTVDVLRLMLERAGFNTVAGHVEDIKRGNTDFVEFLKQHQPDVVIYDISLPYDQNWNFVRLVLNTDVAQNCKFVLTTTNKAALQTAPGLQAEILEIAQKPYDFERIVDAVRKAVRETDAGAEFQV